MKNYSEMSDFEINKAVIKILGIGLISDGDKKCFHISGEEFDPCNNPSDAWPIIIENGVSIRKRYYGEWRAIREWGESHEYDDNNPLRAAMIVYLMMKEAGA